MDDLDHLAQRLHAFESTDKHRYQRQLRVLQSLWREQCGFDVGVHKGRGGERPLGSRLRMPWAGETLANYLTDTIRNVVRSEVLDPCRSRGKLYGTPRIFNDLLSSQPLAFNLFAIPSRDLDLATRWIRRLMNDPTLQVQAIDFEWSPGRGDPKYTGDRSAFDVFVRCIDVAGARTFIGIEVKYHERMDDPPARLRERYEELAGRCGWFRQDRMTDLRNKPLQQVWRDHLLAASLILSGDFDNGRFVVLYPGVNCACANVVSEYRACLSDASTFDAWTLEDAVDALRREDAGPWVEKFNDRYLNLSKLDAAIHAE